MRYHTPATFADAAAIAAKAQGTTRYLAGGTDVLVQLRTDLVTPDDLIDIKRIAGVQRDRARGGWRLADRRCGQRRRVERACQGQARLARCGRGAGSDRLDPGAGPRDADRQPVQRLARRRQRAGDDRGGCLGDGGRARTASARSRSRMCRPGRARPRWRRARWCGPCICLRAARTAATPTCASSRAPRWTSRWSAARCQPDARRRQDHGGARVAGRGGADGAAGGRGGRRR